LIEIPKDKFTNFNSKIDSITRELNNFGYKTVELDPVGFRSGSLNQKAGIKNS
jgi:PP-loop superfamily ATP-utilizing enzyme